MVTKASSFPEQAGTLGALLRGPYRQLSDRLYAKMAAGGFPEIRRSHSLVFRHIAPEGSRLTELAEVSGLTKQSMAYLVGYLEKHGYVKISTDPADGRAKRVQLTNRGRAFVASLLAASADLENEVERKLGSARFKRLRGGLQALGLAIADLP
ncbi:winged helix DNA-binding protein [bacterium]|nr:winged helix DNA-binding protein [bacterium]